MTRRLVVCARWRPPAAVGSVATRAPEETWEQALRTLADRATALGGRLVGWHEGVLSVDFAPDGLQDAVDFLVDEPLATSLSCGMAHGELSTCVESHRMALCTGEVLQVAAALAEFARPGEVLVSPELVVASRGELLTSGPPRRREGREPVPALVLDVVHPLRSLLEEAVARLVDPVWQGEAVPAEDAPSPGRVTVVRGPAGYGGTRWLEELARDRQDVLWVRPGRVGWPCSALSQTFKGTASVAELEASLRGAPIGMVLVDDAEQVDGDSLELLFEVCKTGAFGLVLRWNDAEKSTSQLFRDLVAGADVVTERRLESLSGVAAARLAETATAGRLGEAPRSALEALGQRSPLDALEQVVHALDRGDWVWSDETIQPRSENALEPKAAAQALADRIERLNPRSRLILEALAVLGGFVDAKDTARVLEAVFASGVRATPVEALQEGPLSGEEVARSLPQLVSSRWLRARPFRFASSSARRAVMSQIPPERLRALHVGAARLAVQSGGWAGRAGAVVHAWSSGRAAQARDLARSAEPSLRRAGCVAAADALCTLADEGDPEGLRHRGYLPEEPPASGAAPGEPGIDWRPGAASKSPRPPSVAETSCASETEDTPALEASDRSPGRVAERLEALSRLAQGRPGEAIAILRRAREQAEALGLRERCRAGLALGLALAAAGRAEEAFLQALDALARAREAGDRRGEQASARLLATLARGLGAEAEAERWDALCR